MAFSTHGNHLFFIEANFLLLRPYPKNVLTSPPVTTGDTTGGTIGDADDTTGDTAGSTTCDAASDTTGDTTGGTTGDTAGLITETV